MEYGLNYAESIGALFQLGILVALWGIYTEMRILNQKRFGK